MSLEFSLNRTPAATADVDCVIVGAFADGSLSPAGKALDAASGGRIAVLGARGDVSGKAGKTILLHDLPGITARRVLVIGLGDAGKFGVPQYLKAVADAARALKTGPVVSALFTLSEVAVKDRDASWNIRQAIVAADHACYRYLATLGEKNKKREESGLARLQIAGDDATALAQGVAIAEGVQFTRELGNLPPNVCTPEYLARQVLPALGWETRSAILIGGDTLPERKPHPLPLLHAAAELGVAIDDCVYVGDDRRDIDAARAAGMRSVVALWGYRPDGDEPAVWGGDVMVATPRDLLGGIPTR